MDKNFLLLDAIAAFLAVALGAFGAHGLRGRLSPEMMTVFQTGVQYHVARWQARLGDHGADERVADSDRGLVFRRRHRLSPSAFARRHRRDGSGDLGRVGLFFSGGLSASHLGGKLRVSLIRVTDTIGIEERELEERFVRASGPGGQNVNKVSTAVELRFDVRGSTLPPDVKQRLIALAGTRISGDGVLLIDSREHRTQAMNREAARARLIALLQLAARRPKTADRRPKRAAKGSGWKPSVSAAK
jgi:ribosome-associated protein